MEAAMSVARVTEITSQSGRSFEDAIRQGIRRANATLRNVQGAWIKEQQVAVEDGRITGYRVNMLVTFILEDAPRGRAVKSAMGAAAPATKAPAKKAAKKAATKKSARKTARKRGGRR
jgi:flavin-binding protein dodecin